MNDFCTKSIVKQGLQRLNQKSKIFHIIFHSGVDWLVTTTSLSGKNSERLHIWVLRHDRYQLLKTIMMRKIEDENEWKEDVLAKRH